MFGIVINEQGYKVEFVVLNQDKSPQYYELQECESIIEDGWQIANSMNKPQWTGSEWIDTEPLSPVEPPLVPPDKISILEQENKLLKAQVSALNSTTDFHEELIVELANKVYA